MAETPEFIHVLVTIDDRDAASGLLSKVVGERLAACGHLDGPITSTYWWQGELETEEEYRLEFKTTADLFDTLAARVTELHTYDEPQVIATPILKGTESYLQWIRDETSDARS